MQEKEEFNLEELLNEEFPEDLDDYQITEDNLKSTICNLSSADICNVLLSIKKFGMGKNLEIICMKELVNKRANGDNFSYEEFLNNNQVEKLKTPKLNFDLYKFAVRK
jgi:hypothetical protein